jgi:uncharacterized protein (TIGR03086 family)
MEPLTQLAQVMSLLSGVTENLKPEHLDKPTPCSEFTVRGVLEHMIGGGTAFAAAYRGETPPEPDFSDPLENFSAAMGELSAAVSAPGALDKTVEAPFGEVPGDVFARFIALDGLVHGWDIAQATGQSYDPPKDLVDAVDAFARQSIDPLRGAAFGDAVEPSSGATPIECLAAYTGRSV